MSISLITFATPNFYYSKSTLLRSAKKLGISKSYAFTGNNFRKTEFYQEYSSITEQPRGAGYWIWKPYYILEVLLKLNDDDILIYCDSGVDITGDLSPIIKIASGSSSGIVLFENYQGSGYLSKTKNIPINEYNLYVELNKNKYWTKRDAFVLMGLDSERFWHSPQVNANFQVYRKCAESVSFVKEWLLYCSNEQIITDKTNKSGLPNFPNMFGHIHDQAIISLLAEKYNIELFRCPSQYGNHYKLSEFRIEGEYLLLPYSTHLKLNSDYGTLLYHHRTKFMPFLFRLKSFVKQEIQIAKSYLY